MPNTRTHSVSLYRLYAPYYVRKGGEETDGQYGKPFFFFLPSMPSAAAMRQNKPETELDTHNTRVVGPTTQETALECRYGCTKRTIRLEKYSVETHGEKKRKIENGVYNIRSGAIQGLYQLDQTKNAQTHTSSCRMTWS